MGMSSTDNGDRFRNQRQTRLRIALEHDWDVNTAALDNVIWRLSYSPQNAPSPTVAGTGTQKQTRISMLQGIQTTARTFIRPISSSRPVSISVPRNTN